MILRKSIYFPPLRFVVAAAWLLGSLLIVSAPILAIREHYATSSTIYFIFSRVCHQAPERSFTILGLPFAVCHRCFGIYLGLAVGSLFKIPFSTVSMRRIWIIAAMVPLLIDVVLPLIGLWDNTPASRFLTGHFFGVMLGSIFLQGILELVHPISRLRLIYKGEVP